MALIIETGLGVPDAESYISVADADAYHAARGNAAWEPLTDEQKEQALRRATGYMLETYRARWKGQRMYSTQSLDWPRYNVTVDSFVVGSDVVPSDVANACAVLALKANAGDLTVDATRLAQSVTVGPISKTYAEGGSAQTRYVAVDNLLSAYLRSGSGQVALVRA